MIRLRNPHTGEIVKASYSGAKLLRGRGFTNPDAPKREPAKPAKAPKKHAAHKSE